VFYFVHRIALYRKLEDEDGGTHQTFALYADEVAIASVAPGTVDHVAEVVAEAETDSDTDQSTLVVTCAHSVRVTQPAGRQFVISIKRVKAFPLHRNTDMVT